MVSMRRTILIVLSLTVLLSLLPSTTIAATYVVEPVLVAQPVYAGMSFYVYRPYNMPSGWFVTFDGYPITRSPAGVWVYGSYNGTLLSPTSFVVGSISPQSLPIVQYVPSARVSSMQSLPVTPLPPLSAPIQPDPGAYVFAEAVTVAPTYVPEWTTQSSFTSIGTWNKLVDRMGILEKPRVPIAWRGERPEALFVWTGKSWYQIQARPGVSEKPSEMIKDHLYALTRMVKNNAYQWKDADTAILANQAAVWGYLWMGRIAPSNL